MQYNQILDQKENPALLNHGRGRDSRTYFIKANWLTEFSRDPELARRLTAGRCESRISFRRGWLRSEHSRELIRSLRQFVQWLTIGQRNDRSPGVIEVMLLPINSQVLINGRQHILRRLRIIFWKRAFRIG